MKDKDLDKRVNKQGAPWKTAYRAVNYEDADNRRNELLHGWKSEGVSDMQVKVKWMPSTDSFVVKTRKNPASSKPAKKKPAKKSKD